MKIVLDFDDTIFNTHFLMHGIAAIFKEAEFTEKEFFEAYQKCKKRVGDFDKKILINFLSELKSFDKKKVDEDIDSIISKSSDFVYSDFFNFVNNFNKKDLILLSFGTTDFQGMKIKNSGIASYFQEVIITQKDKTENLKNVLKKDESEKIFFIDDKAKQVDIIKEKLPQIITMKMERPQGGHINTKSKLTDYVVKDLGEAKNIINDLNK